MYESFFGFKTKPFELLPNPEFMFLSKTHKRAITYLEYGIRERVGFILLTGEVGSGKTTVIREILNREKNRIILARIFNTKVDSDQLMTMVNDDFDLPIEGKGKVSLLRDLNEFLIEQYRMGKRPVLLIDEAQNLTVDVLEEIRLLSNLEVESAKLLQIILVGQPELKKSLALPELRQLRQRINISCHLNPLSPAECGDYILHRLQVAGNKKAVNFTAEALDVIFAYSRGIPRLINIICDFLLLSAFVDETKDVDEGMVREVVGELDFEHEFWPMDVEGCSRDAGALTRNADDRSIMMGTHETEKIYLLVSQISARLDEIENSTQVTTQVALSAVRDRLDVVQNALKYHVGENDSIVAELSQRIEKLSKFIESNHPAEKAAKSERTGIVRRILGG